MSEPKLNKISGVGPATAQVLAESGFASVEAVAKANIQEIARVPGFGEARAATVIAAAGLLQSSDDAPSSGESSKKDKSKKRKKKKKKRKDKKKSGKGKKSKKKDGKKKDGKKKRKNKKSDKKKRKKK